MSLQTQSPEPPKLGIACPPACQFHPDKIGWKTATALAATRARGAGVSIWGRRAAELIGHQAPPASIQRHFKHYRQAASEEPDPEVTIPTVKKSDIEILDQIIAAGSANSKNWKPSIRDTLDAMKLKAQFTGNSAFDDLLALFDVNDDDEDAPEEVIEAPEAVSSEEERSNASPEDE